VVPDGYKLSSGSCVELVDRCPALAGIQEEIPAGMLLTREYGCISERELDKIEAAEREVSREAKKCDDLKTLVYEADQEVIDIQEKYRKQIESLQGQGNSKSTAQSQTNNINRQMYAEIAPIEAERNKIANQYNFECL
jgi:DNA repair ATPase RecN